MFLSQPIHMSVFFQASDKFIQSIAPCCHKPQNAYTQLALIDQSVHKSRLGNCEILQEIAEGIQPVHCTVSGCSGSTPCASCFELKYGNGSYCMKLLVG